jgi:AcrR family transcriptional regulator
MAEQGARERLLAAVIDHVAGHGVGDLSLRRLAAAIGTSHRMLLYHFGSKEGLLVEVVKAVEDRQRAALEELRAATGGPELSLEVMQAFWRRLADPAMWPFERLFFEVYGQAVQGRPGTTGLLDGLVGDWLGPVAEAAEAAGSPPGDAEADARLAVAVTRGLLLDLLATGDREGVDAAMRRFTTVWAAGTVTPER